MKRSILSLIVAFMVLSTTVTSYAVSFKDLTDSKGAPHWSSVYIKDIADKGLVSGYADGTFKPNSPVSRVDAIVFMSRLYPMDIIKSTYADNKAKWTTKLNTYNIPEYGRSAIVFALENSWFGEAYLKEFMDASTKKQKDALRYEFCVYLVRALNWETQLSNAAVVKYKDANTIIKQAVSYIELLGRKGIVATTGEFMPNKPVTRGETAKMLSVSYPSSEKAKDDAGNVEPDPGTGTGTTTPPNPDSGKVVMPSGVIVEGVIKSINLDDNNMIVMIEDSKGYILGFSNKASGVVVAVDEKSAKPEDIKVGYTVKLYTDSTTVKGIEATSMQDVNKTEKAEVIEVTSSSIEIKLSNGKTEKYDIASRPDVEKNGKSASVSDVASGDEVKVKIEKSIVTQIDANSVKRTLKDVVIKGITINSNSSAIVTFMDKDGQVRKMNIGSASVIYMKNSRASVSDIKIGYEADVYANSNEVLDLTLYSQTKGEVFVGSITDVNTKEDYFLMKDSDGKTKKVIIDSKTDIFDYITGKAQYIRDLEKGQKVIITGYEGIDIIEATKVSYYY